MATKAEMLKDLKQMLRDVFAARHAGGGYQKLVRDQGYVDGYMRALLDGGVTNKEELLRIVAAERAAVSGPATRELALDDAAEAAA